MPANVHVLGVVSSEGDVMPPHFIDLFWSKEFWPPNSPDLNPLDYYVWSVVERVTNKSRHPNVASLRTAIKAAFADRQRYTTTCMRTLQIENRGRD